MTEIIRYTKFVSNPFGDGGAKRSAQIEEHLSGVDSYFLDESFILPKDYSKVKAVTWVIRAFFFISKYVGWKHFSGIAKKIDAILLFALRIPVVYDKYRGKDIIFIWENTQDYAPLYLMKAAGAKVIAYPHNLESLVPAQTDLCSGKISPYWLYEEIERYKKCDEVYCISKEETWLLGLFGVKAFYYPYYPAKAAELFFISVCEKRKKRSDNVVRQYLILGSATNPPTRIGMESLIAELIAGEINYMLDVAGYGTESLNKCTSPNVSYLGAINQNELMDCLVKTDGLIINQPPTSGALTRIAEMRIAGVPVFVNFSAARDYYNLEGVLVYSSIEELKEKL